MSNSSQTDEDELPEYLQDTLNKIVKELGFDKESPLQKKRIFIASVEQSGDKLSAELIQMLEGISSKRKDIEFEYEGISGQEVNNLINKEEGKIKFKKFKDIKELSFIGFADVLLNIRKIKKIIQDTANYITKTQPDYVITVDGSSFAIRLAKLVKEKLIKKNPQNKNIKFVQYVVPKVWASREGRAEVFSKLYHKLFCIMPNELDYFLKYNADISYIGFPMYKRYRDAIKDDNTNKICDEFLKKYTINKKQDLITTITLGSRGSEVKRHIPIIKGAIEIIKKHCKKIYPDKRLVFLCPSLERFAGTIKNSLPELIVTTGKDDYTASLFLSDVAIVKSGTNAVEYSMFGVPAITYYNMPKFTEVIARMVYKSKFVNLVNIMPQQEVIPELIQKKANSINIANHVLHLMDNDFREGKIQVGNVEDLKEKIMDVNPEHFEMLIERTFCDS